MIDIDYSFLRLRDNLTDAINLSESPANDFEYVGQVQLLPTETYLQISNSPTDINLSSWEAHFVDACGNEVLDITNNIFITNFTDSNGRQQIAWEFINRFEYYTKPLSIRFTETSNGDQWFTNLFLSTAYNSELTIRFDYKNIKYHYGTEYERANYYSSIRLIGYYKNKINESERSEYHQITTDVTVPTRNIRKIKERYLLDDMNDWTSLRLETLLTCNEVYLDNIRTYSTTPLEFVEGEMDSNISLHEMIVNKDYSQTFTFEYQIFEGFFLSSLYVEDDGYYSPASVNADLVMTFNVPISIDVGSISIYDVAEAFPRTPTVTYTELDMIVTGNTLTIEDVFGTGNEIDSTGSYYINVSSGLVLSAGTLIEYTGISDGTTWNFTFVDGMFDSTEFDNTEFLTD